MDDFDGYVDIHGSDDDSGGNVSPLPEVLLGAGRVADSAATDEHSAAHEKLVIQTMLAGGLIEAGAQHAIGVAQSLMGGQRVRSAIEILELVTTLSPSDIADAPGVDNLVLQSMLLQSEAYQAVGEPAAAVPMLRQAIILANDRGDDVVYKSVVAQLAKLRSHQIDYVNDAIDSYKQALRIKTKVSGKDHTSVGATQSNLGRAYKSIGDFNKALASYSRALSIKNKNGEDIATTVNNIAEVYRCMGDQAMSLKYYMWAYDLRFSTDGETAEATVNTMYNIGLLQRQLQDFNAAESSFKNVVAALLVIHAQDHPEIVDAESQARRCAELREKAKANRFTTFVLSKDVEC